MSKVKSNHITPPTTAKERARCKREREYPFTMPSGKKVMFTGLSLASAKIEFEAYLLRSKPHTLVTIIGARSIREKQLLRSQSITAARTAVRAEELSARATAAGQSVADYVENLREESDFAKETETLTRAKFARLIAQGV